MKRFSLVLKLLGALCLSSLLFTTACAPVDSITPGDVITVVSASGSPVLVPVTGTPGRQVVTVSANARWEVYVTYADPAVNYVHVTPKSGGLGNTKIEYTVDPNPYDIPRECEIHIAVVGGDVTTDIPVVIKQEGSFFEIPAYIEGTDQIDVLPAGGTSEIELTRATRDWTVASSEDWIEVTPLEGTAFNVDPNAIDPALTQKVTWTAQPNPSPTDTREAEIVFSCGESYTYVVKAVQAPAALELFKEEACTTPLAEVDNINPSQTDVVFYVKANREWEVTASQAWVTAAPATALAGIVKVTATVEPNVAETPRTAELTFKAGDAEAVLTLTQKAAGFAIEDALLNNAEDNRYALTPYAQTDKAVKTVYTTSGKPWTATVAANELGVPAPEWLKVKEDVAGKQIILTWDANPYYMPRYAKILLTCDQLVEVLYLVQEASKFETKNGADEVNEIAVAANGTPAPQKVQASITSKTQFFVKLEKFAATDVDAPADWITIQNLEAFNALTSWDNAFEFAFEFAPNPREAERKAYLTLYQQESDPNDVFVFKQILITQAATVDATPYDGWTFAPDGSLVDPASNSLEFKIDNGMPIACEITYSGEQKDWLTLDPANGKLNNTTAKTLKITAKENPKPERIATLTVTCGELVKTITLTQKAAGAILIEGKANLTLKAWKGHELARKITLSSNKIKATTTILPAEAAEWVEVTYNPEVFTKQALTFKAKTYNPNVEPREAVIVFAQADVKDSVKVIQEGSEFTLAANNILVDGKKQDKAFTDFVSGNIYNGTAQVADCPWVLIPDASATWYTIEKDGENNLKLSFEQNRTTHDRTSTVQVKVANLPAQNIVIRQEKGFMKFNPGVAALVEVPSKENEYLWNNPIDANADTTWILEAEGNPTWFTMEQEVVAGNVNIKFNFEANPVDTERSAKVWAKYPTAGDDVALSFRVVQKAGDLLFHYQELEFSAEGEMPNDITAYINEHAFVNPTNELSWKVESVDWHGNDPWFVVTPSDDPANSIRFYDVLYNKLPEIRYAHVTVISGTDLENPTAENCIRRTFKVWQEAGALRLNGTVLELPNPEADPYTTGDNFHALEDRVDINNSELWTVEAAANNWMQVERINQTDFALRNIKANPTDQPREVLVTVTSEAGFLTATLNVIQPATTFTAIPAVLTAPSDDAGIGAWSGVDAQVAVSTDNGMAWTVTADAAYDWIACKKSDDVIVFENVKPNTNNVPRTATFTVSCGEMTLPVVVNQYTSELSVTNAVVEFTPVAHTNYAVTGINAQVDWQVDPARIDWQGNAPWFTLDKYTYKPTATAFTLNSVEANPTDQPRTAFVTVFVNDEITAQVAVKQQPGAITLSGELADATIQGLSGQGTPATNYAAVTTNNGLPWTLSFKQPAEWLEAVKNGNAIRLTTQANNSGASRYATLVITCGEMTREVIVEQNGSTITTSANSANLSAAAHVQVEVTQVTAVGPWTVEVPASAPWLTAISMNGSLYVNAEANPSAQDRVAILTLRCGEDTFNFQVVQAGAEMVITTPWTSYIPAAESFNMMAAGGIMPTHQLPWTATVDVDWITLVTPAGLYGEDLFFNAQPNPTTEVRNAKITLTSGELTHVIELRQEAAAFVLPTQVVVLPTGEVALVESDLQDYTNESSATITIDVQTDGTTFKLPVTPTNHMSWTATATESWITLQQASGDWGTQVVVTVDPNGDASRQGDVMVTVGEVTRQVHVYQKGNAIDVDDTELNFTGKGEVIDPSTTIKFPMPYPLDNTYIVGVPVNPAYGLPWSATSNESWVKVTSGGVPAQDIIDPSKLLEILVEPNPTGAPRMATITVTAGTVNEYIKIHQGIFNYELYVTSPVVMGPAAAENTLSNALETILPWTATSNDSWIQMMTSSGPGKSTSQDVTFRVQPNPTGSVRYGTFTITSGGVEKTVTVQQAGAELTVPEPVAPELAFIYEGDTYNIQELGVVSNTNGMGWTATVAGNPSWVTCVPSGDSGTKLRINLTKNETTEVRAASIEVRSGDITKVVLIKQKVYVPPFIILVDDTDAPVTDIVLTQAGAGTHSGTTLLKATHDWTATVAPGGEWVTVTPPSGIVSVEGTPVSFTVAANEDFSSRSTTVTFEDVNGLKHEVDIEQPGLKILEVLDAGVQIVGSKTITLPNYGAQTYQLTVKSSEVWSAGKNVFGAWTSCSPMGPNVSTYGQVLTIDFDANTGIADRSVTYTVTSVLGTVEIMFIQPPMPPTLAFRKQNASGEVITTTHVSYLNHTTVANGATAIYLEANMPWTANVISGSGWLSLDSGSGSGSGSQVIQVKTTQLNGTTQRNGTIRVTMGSQTVDLTVTQDPNPFTAVRTGYGDNSAVTVSYQNGLNAEYRIPQGGSVVTFNVSPDVSMSATNATITQSGANKTLTVGPNTTGAERLIQVQYTRGSGFFSNTFTLTFRQDK